MDGLDVGKEHHSGTHHRHFFDRLHRSLRPFRHPLTVSRSGCQGQGDFFAVGTGVNTGRKWDSSGFRGFVNAEGGVIPERSALVKSASSLRADSFASTRTFLMGGQALHQGRAKTAQARLGERRGQSGPPEQRTDSASAPTDREVRRSALTARASARSTMEQEAPHQGASWRCPTAACCAPPLSGLLGTQGSASATRARVGSTLRSSGVSHPFAATWRHETIRHSHGGRNQVWAAGMAAMTPSCSHHGCVRAVTLPSRQDSGSRRPACRRRPA